MPVSTLSFVETRPRTPADRARIRVILDGSGGLLVAATIGWLLLTAEASGGDAFPAGRVLLLAAFAYGVATATSRHHPWIVAFAITAGSAVYALARIGVLLERPNDGPLGYSNAAGSLFMLAAGAALLVVARAADPVMRIGCGIAAFAFALVPWLNGTTAAAGLVLLLPAGLAARSERATRFAIVASLAAVAVSLVTAVVLGATYRYDRGAPAWIDATLSERRLMLWRDAIDLILARPLAGVGPGRFPEFSPTALSDADTIWPHNEILHLGAEAGLPGVAFLAAILAWCFARLWWGGGDTGATIAALSVGAVAVHSNIDYVLHYPAVAMYAAALVGVGARRRRTLRVSSARYGGRHRDPVDPIVTDPGEEPA